MDVQGIGQYSRPWKQIVMFISRTRDPCEWTIPKIKLRGKQRQAWKHMMLLARASSSGSNVVPDAWEEEDARESPRPIGASGEHPHDEQNPYQLRSLAKACLTFCIALLDERMTHKEYHSPMVCALAVLGVKIDGWLGPDRYPPILSTVIKISRFMVIQDALETTDLVESEFSGEDSRPSSSNSDARSREVQQDCLWLVQDAMNRFMVRGSHSPMQWMLDLRTYGLKIHYNTTTEGCIDWVGEQIVYKNIQFIMAELRKMVEELTMKSRQMLFEKLMFVENEQDAPMIPWSALRDNPVNQEQGWNFIRDERNPWLVDGSRWLQDRIQSYPEIQRGFIRSGEQLRWNKPVIRAYMSRVVEFRQRLLALFHIIGGQPARGPEILSVRHSNSSKGQHRNIFVEDELVVFVTRYHKGYHVFGSVKIIHRYIPRAVSELFVYYQWLVKPFQDLIEAEIWDRSTISPFMWPADPGGKEWTSQRFSQGLKEASRCGIGASIGIQAWRDIAIGISRRYLRQEHVFRPNENDEEGIAEEAEEIHDAQAAHTSHVAGQVYARGIMEMEGVVASRRQRFRTTSVAWHRFLGFEEIEMGRGKRRRGPFETEAENVLFQRWKRMRGLNIHDEFRRMMNPQAEFRRIQSTAIQAIVRGESPVVMVMGTGGGKSMGFMLPAWCSKDGVSVVVVPLIALRQDMMIRCRGMGIPCREWSRGSIPHAARLIFVTPESAISEDFQTCINRLQATQQLDRIIIDECHVILNNQLDFRRKLQRMGELSRVGVQMVLMTATLSPSQEAELWNRMRWNGDQVQLFRAGTTRKNVAYRVVFIGVARDECNPIVEAIEQKMEQYPEGKIVIYCHSVRKSQDLAEHLGCAAYHHHAKEKEAILNGFCGVDRLMVATSAFGMGIDVANIRVVMHTDRPRTLLDYAQESERAGRDGGKSEAIMMLQEREEEGEVRTAEEQLVDRMIQGEECQRQVLDQHLDGRTDRVGCEEGEEACGVCAGFGFGWQRGEVREKSVESKTVVETFIEQKYRRMAIQQQYQERIQSEAREVAKLRQHLNGRVGQCPFCRWVGMEAAGHRLKQCRVVGSGRSRELQEQIRGTMRRVRGMEAYGGCVRCFVPQA